MISTPWGFVLIFLNLSIWASSFALSKLAIVASDVLLVTGARMVIAGVVLAGFARWKRRDAFHIPRAAWIQIAVLSITAFYLANVFEFRGLVGMSAGKASFMYGISPIISALLSYVQLRETVTVKKMVGMGIALIGYILYVVRGEQLHVVQGTWQFGMSEILMLGATFLSAFGWTFLRKIEKTFTEISVLSINAIAMTLAGVLSLVHSVCVESWSPTPVIDWMGFAQGVLGLVLFSNILCYNMQGYLLKKFSSTFLSFCCLSMPIFSSFYGWLLLGEPIHASLIQSVILMLIGCRLVYHEEFKQGYVLNNQSG